MNRFAFVLCTAFFVTSSFAAEKALNDLAKSELRNPLVIVSKAYQKELDLTPDQNSKLFGIAKDFSKAKVSGKSKSERRASYEKLRAETVNQMLGQLNDQQTRRLAQLFMQRQGDFAFTLPYVQSELQFTDAQKATLQKNAEKFQEINAAIKAAKSKWAAQTARERLKLFQKQSIKELLALPTEEQKQELAELLGTKFVRPPFATIDWEVRGRLGMPRAKKAPSRVAGPPVARATPKRSTTRSNDVRTLVRQLLDSEQFSPDSRQLALNLGKMGRPVVQPLAEALWNTKGSRKNIFEGFNVLKQLALSKDPDTSRTAIAALKQLKGSKNYAVKSFSEGSLKEVNGEVPYQIDRTSRSSLRNAVYQPLNFIRVPLIKKALGLNADQLERVRILAIEENRQRAATRFSPVYRESLRQELRRFLTRDQYLNFRRAQLQLLGASSSLNESDVAAKLKLTKAQRNRLLQINYDFTNERSEQLQQAVQGEGRLTENRQNKLIQKFDAKARAVLTPDQARLFDKILGKPLAFLPR